MATNKPRFLSIELLRIIAMFMIVMHHSVYHGLFDGNHHLTSLQSIVAGWLGMFGKVGVDIFIIISGYFLITTTKNRFERLKITYREIWIYSILFFLLNLIFHIKKTTLKLTLQAVMPIIFGEYWFMTAYVILILLIPFINQLIQHLDKQKYQQLLIILILFSIVIPTIPKTNVQENYLALFITLYLTGGYFRLYPTDYSVITKRLLAGAGFILSLLILGGSVVILKSMGSKELLDFAITHNAFVYLMACSLFILFKHLHIANRYSFIAAASSTTLGIYLIHDNPIVRQLIWKKLFHLNTLTFSSTTEMVVMITVMALTIFLVCMWIDFIRQWISHSFRQLQQKAKK